MITVDVCFFFSTTTTTSYSSFISSVFSTFVFSDSPSIVVGSLSCLRNNPSSSSSAEDDVDTRVTVAVTVFV